MHIPFDEQTSKDLAFRGNGIPEHTQYALEKYLLEGWPPAGFLEAVLTNDLFRAVSNADIANRERLWEITRWVLKYAPGLSWGSKGRVEAWCDPECQVRLAFRDKVLKEKMWSRLLT